MRNPAPANKQKSEILDAVAKYLKRPMPEDAAPVFTPAPAEFLPQALFASAALSGLMTSEIPRIPFRFHVRLEPEGADPFFVPTPEQSFDYSIDISLTSVDLRIHAIPAHLPSAPGEFLHALVTFLAASAYVESMRAFYPDRRWKMASPAESLLLDALNTSEQARADARIKLWN